MNQKEIRKMLLKVLQGYNVVDKKGDVRIAHDLYKPYLHYWHYGSSAIRLDDDILESFTWLMNTIFNEFNHDDFYYIKSDAIGTNYNIGGV